MVVCGGGGKSGGERGGEGVKWWVVCSAMVGAAWGGYVTRGAYCYMGM